MVLSETIYVMLLTHPKWKMFTKKEIPNAKADVDTITNGAAKAGGKADPNPVQDHGFMYGRSFEDLNGHIWESVLDGYECGAGVVVEKRGRAMRLRLVDKMKVYFSYHYRST